MRRAERPVLLRGWYSRPARASPLTAYLIDQQAAVLGADPGAEPLAGELGPEEVPGGGEEAVEQRVVRDAVGEQRARAFHGR